MLANRVLCLALIAPLIFVNLSAGAHAQTTTGSESQRREIAIFPDVSDLKSVVIMLYRAGGMWSFGSSYSLKITGEGIVDFHSNGGYHLTGRHRSRITNEEVRRLVEAFREADFYSLEDQSQQLVFDAGCTEITFTIGGRTRTVLDRDSGSQKFNQLAASIDQLSHADQWLKGNSETVPGLLAHKENLNVPDDEGNTVLMWACQRADATAVREFLLAGANLRATDKYGRSALMYAAARGLPEILEVLLQAGADPKEPDHYGETPLIFAAGIRDVWFGRWFSAAGDSSLSWWPIIDLFGEPSPEVVRMLLRASADPNASDSEGATALMYAVESFKAGTDILRALVDGGANLNQQDNEGRTALMRAADRYQVEAVRFLIAAKANLNSRDSQGRTALGRLHPPRDKLFRHSPEYKQIRLLLKQAGAVR